MSERGERQDDAEGDERPTDAEGLAGLGVPPGGRPGARPDERPDGPSDDGAAPPASSPLARGDLARRPRLVVAVGASAGGLESLERLFAHVPAETGFAFVVIQHLSPHHKTMMVELLARRTVLDVRTAAHGVLVRRDTVHVMPPGTWMTIENGRLLLAAQGEQLPNLPIDRFFSSLAADVGARAVAIVLSGTGADGSRGIVDVAAQGALVLAETEVTAAFSGMPDSAVASGCVDYSLAPEEMIEILEAHVRRRGAQGTGEAVADDPADGNASARGTGRVLERLHDAYGIDFTQYKPATVARRIERRIELSDTEGGIERYIERLDGDDAELDVLYHDLLIGVTHFFRDAACFSALELEALPRLFARLGPDHVFRAWVAGCASGEEAYTLAMLVQEQIEASGRERQAKIFATDLHGGALERASLGIYPAEQLEQLTESRRARWFEPCEGGYRVVDEIRRHVVFARHDLLADAPFTRLDLVSCRNLLIYFELPAQRKALRLFHFALRVDGVLMLGPSETLGQLAEHFETLDEARRLYRKTHELRLPDDVRFEPPTLVPALPLGRAAHRRVALATGRGPGSGGGITGDAAIDARLIATYDLLLERHMPPSVLIDADERVVDSYAGAARFLRFPRRRPDADLFVALDTPSAPALRQALRQVRVGGESALVYDVQLRDADGKTLVRDVRIDPLARNDAPIEHLLLSIDEREPDAAALAPSARELDGGGVARERTVTVAGGADREPGGPGDDAALRHEIDALQRRLQRTAELAEAGREELQATNEELVASNEELQSSNEELNSVNEELHTVNSEYQGKIAELRELNEDMHHLLASTDIGTVFLDRELRIRRFTSGIARAYDLAPGDIGRSIESFAPRIDVSAGEMRRRLVDVLGDGRSFEREVRDRDGKALLLRVLPYELGEQVAGVVVTLIDIELLDDARVALADSETALQRRLAELQTLYATMPAGLCFIGRDLRYVRANRRMSEIDGVPLEQYVGHSVHDVLPPALAARVAGVLEGLFESGEPWLDHEMKSTTKAHPDEIRSYIVNYHPVREPGGEITGASCVVVENPLARGRSRTADAADGPPGEDRTR